MSRNLLRATTLALAIILSVGVAAARQPRLVINVVVGSMRASDLERYADNFVSDGFRRLMDGGVCYTNAYYDYTITSTPSGLATLVTGVDPSTHGIIGERWWSPIDGEKIELVYDASAYALIAGCGTCNYSPVRLVAPTLGDMLLVGDKESKHYTIAIDPMSSIVLNGKSGVALWAESNKTRWITSSAFASELPAWLDRYNKEGVNSYYALRRWTTLYDASRYYNSRVAVLEGISNKSTTLISDVDLKLAETAYGKMLYTPAGNTMLLNLATTLITQEALGKDAHPDILNIYLDTARHIAEIYGTESMEYEDMIYRLDSQLSHFLAYVYAQFGNAEDVVVVLTSDHGTSPSTENVNVTTSKRVNMSQVAVLTNAFLGARYGSDNYILGVANKAIYLDHNVILKRRLSLNDVREEVAIFLLQIRGISNALSASSLRGGSFAEGRSRLVQMGYYATRSGDVVFDLMPGYIIDSDNRRSRPDGGYNYDRHVPLIIYRSGDGEVVQRRVSMTEVAPTIAKLVGVETPWASEAMPLSEF